MRERCDVFPGEVMAGQWVWRVQVLHNRWLGACLKVNL